MKIVNLPAERLTAGTDERLNLIEEAVSLRRMAKMLRAKSDELRRRNILVVREANAATQRGLQVSLDIFEAMMEMRFALIPNKSPATGEN